MVKIRQQLSSTRKVTKKTNRTAEIIQQYIKVIEQLKSGDYISDIPISSLGEMKLLGLALRELAQTLEGRRRELRQLDQITARINAGLRLDDILEQTYQDFQDIIPYNRIGFSLIQADGKIVRARWEKSDQPAIHLQRDYAAPLKGSSLQNIIDTGQPRIINDLTEYLKAKPDSSSTRLITAEGIRSSLTCPLIANSTPVGFIFFSSIHPCTYTDVHIEIFQKIAAQLSTIVEKGGLVSELMDQKEAIEHQHKELHLLYSLQEEYLQQATRITQAAAEVERGEFNPDSLDEVARRTDALGRLARVFQEMARKVFAREQGLKQQLQKLYIEFDEIKRAQEVQEITNSDSFRALQEKVRQIRSKRAH